MPTRQLVVQPIDEGFSLKEHIYGVLKAGITAMDIYADDVDLRLDERQLAEKLRISRTPVREALARLEQEGLVTILPRKGVYIARKSKREILEMVIAWAALEGMAARLATERASPAEIGALRKLFAAFGKDEIHARIDEYSERNIEFHQRILELSKCKLLSELASGLFIHMRAIRARAMGEGDRADRSIVDHIHIIEALEAHDADLAERLVREHTLNLHAHIERHWVEPADGLAQANLQA
jgi:DNA-binding GntR family transcriptional regulator